MNELTPDEHNIIVDAIHDSATVIHKGQRMNERIKQLMGQTLDEKFSGTWSVMDMQDLTKFADRFAEVIVRECAKVADIADENKCEWIGGNILTHFGVEDRAVPILSADEQALFAGITSSKLFTIAAAKKAFGVKE